MTVPKISIIVPVYNGRNYVDSITDYLKSLKGDFETEIIFSIDPKTNDDSVPLLEKIIADGKLDWKIVRSEYGGVGQVRNAGLNVANGDYIWNLDIDDDPSPQLLSVIVKDIEKYNPDCISFNYNRCERGTPQPQIIINDYDAVKTEIITSDDAIRRYLIIEMPMTSWSNVFKNTGEIKKLRFVEEHKCGAEDDHFSIRLFSLSKSICFHETSLYNYYYNKNDAWRKKRSIDGINAIFTDLEKWLHENNPNFERDIRLYKVRYLMHRSCQEGYDEYKKLIKSEQFENDVKSLNEKTMEFFIFNHFKWLYYHIARYLLKRKREGKVGA